MCEHLVSSWRHNLEKLRWCHLVGEECRGGGEEGKLGELKPPAASRFSLCFMLACRSRCEVSTSSSSCHTCHLCPCLFDETGSYLSGTVTPNNLFPPSGVLAVIFYHSHSKGTKRGHCFFLPLSPSPPFSPLPPLSPLPLSPFSPTLSLPLHSLFKSSFPLFPLSPL